MLRLSGPSFEELINSPTARHLVKCESTLRITNFMTIYSVPSSTLRHLDLVSIFYCFILIKDD